jgi:urease accessory protein
MNQRHYTIRSVGRLAFAVLALNLVTVVSARAHHPMGGKTPSTFVEGLLSGLGHPVIGIDHLAFIVAVGVAVGVAGLSLAIPAVFVGASALGVAAHVSGVSVPGVELVVATSVVLAGGLLAAGGTERLNMRGWTALFGVAGLFHGYAYGESIFGAEAAPLSAYLLGLVIVQTVLATTVAWLIRRKGAAMLVARLTGAVIAGIGLATLAGQIVPA